MPLTGYELYASGVDLPEATREQLLIMFSSGDRDLRLRLSRENAVRLLGLLGAALADTEAVDGIGGDTVEQLGAH